MGRLAASRYIRGRQFRRPDYFASAACDILEIDGTGGPKRPYTTVTAAPRLAAADCATAFKEQVLDSPGPILLRVMPYIHNGRPLRAYDKGLMAVIPEAVYTQTRVQAETYFYVDGLNLELSRNPVSVHCALEWAVLVNGLRLSNSLTAHTIGDRTALVATLKRALELAQGLMYDGPDVPRVGKLSARLMKTTGMVIRGAPSPAWNYALFPATFPGNDRWASNKVLDLGACDYEVRQSILVGADVFPVAPAISFATWNHSLGGTDSAQGAVEKASTAQCHISSRHRVSFDVRGVSGAQSKQ